MSVRIWITATLLLVAALASAPAALARTTKSSNWAGYAVHRPGVSFQQVSGTWTQPNVSCASGQPTYSAMWVGLGGYKPTSNALEQIGTEVDCGAGGSVVSSAWYELVPAPSKTISLVVQPGDVMHATVTVAGHQVTVELQDLTSHHTFRKTLTAPAVDVSSAEWIVEAPSECISAFACQALPLADFGSVTFDAATASTAMGSTGSIVDPSWWRTKIKLTPGSERFIVARHSSGSAGTATPSTLRSQGSAFDVTYSAVAVQPNQYGGTRQPRLRAGYLEH